MIVERPDRSDGFTAAAEPQPAIRRTVVPGIVADFMPPELHARGIDSTGNSSFLRPGTFVEIGGT